MIVDQPEVRANLRFARLEDFEAYAFADEQRDAILEWIHGEVYDVPSNPYVSAIAMRLVILLGAYLAENDLGHVTGEAAGYVIGGQVLAPDVAYTSYARQPDLEARGFGRVAPDLAVEVISSQDNLKERDVLRWKVGVYLSHGVTVWVIDPFGPRVELYAPGQPPQELSLEGVIRAEHLLPGLAIPVAKLLPQKKGS
jgi:Uma2 family endonuclease